MKILYSCTGDLSKTSAERTHVSEIVNNLAELGHEVHLVASKKGDLKLHPNVKFYSIFPIIDKRVLFPVTQSLQRIRDRRLILKIIRKKEIDVVYERDNWYNFGFLGRKYDAHTILELNGIPQYEAEISGSNNTEIEALIDRTRNEANRYDTLIAASKGVRDYYISIGIEKNKIHVINNGVNTELFKPLDKKECKKQIRVSGDFIIGFIGSFRPYQGLEDMIRMMKFLIRENPGIKLLIIGDAGRKDGFQFHPTIEELKRIAIEENVSKNVIFTGRVKYKEIPFYINSFDVGLVFRNRLPEGEYSPLKMMEYLSCGIPVISTNWRPFRFIEDEELGFLVDSTNHEEIANVISKAISDDDLLAEMGKNAREYATKFCSWKIAAKRIIEIIE